DALPIYISRFNVGWRDDPAKPAKELIRNSSPTCSHTKLEALETALLNFYPGWEKTVDGRQAFGFSQYGLLSSIAEARRSVQVMRRLQELKRKFGSLLDEPRVRYVGGAIGPPIKSAAADIM